MRRQSKPGDLFVYWGLTEYRGGLPPSCRRSAKVSELWSYGAIPGGPGGPEKLSVPTNHNGPKLCSSHGVANGRNSSKPVSYGALMCFRAFRASLDGLHAHDGRARMLEPCIRRRKVWQPLTTDTMYGVLPDDNPLGGELPCAASTSTDKDIHAYVQSTTYRVVQIRAYGVYFTCYRYKYVCPVLRTRPQQFRPVPTSRSMINSPDFLHPA